MPLNYSETFLMVCLPDFVVESSGVRLRMKINQQIYSGKVDPQEMIHLARECQAQTLHWIDLPSHV
jgi:hypothetical protein